MNNTEKLAEKLCNDLGKEDLVWDTEDSFFSCKKYLMSDEAIKAGLGISDEQWFAILDNREVLKGEF